MNKKCNKCGIELLVGENWHKSFKNSNNYSCKTCCNNYRKRYYSNNRERELKKCKDYQQKNKEKVAKYQKRYREINKEKLLKDGRVRSKLHYKANKERIKKEQRKYRQLNKKEHLARNSKRKALKKMALPKWVNLKKIEEFYKNCPEGYHVDHIYPLNSKKVCGLHVIENLQYLTAEENLKKGNKLPEEYYDN